MKPYTTKLRCFYFWRPETRSAGDFTHSLPGSCAIKFNMAGNVQFLDLTPSKRVTPRHENIWCKHVDLPIMPRVAPSFYYRELYFDN